ncbi:ABC transporter ATP-binding protein [Candidatus Cardinium hertigii]|uniref:Putative ABC transporter ATP-binding protein n=1 Tax=Candidatus Cardinium hertigii TaxID=247481 RepID=A0A2Z3L7R4_9BACT|nr:ABC transporter ATP-binding protein [Candidatus Cardinium hertigii]AWN81501.1 putative ABC transporter ATP-binding protein [Candidatus Cardinium hertigii]
MILFRYILRTLYPFKRYLVALLVVLLIYSTNVFFKTQVIKNLVDYVANASATKDSIGRLIGHFMAALFIELLAFRLQEWCTLRYEPALQNHITTLTFQHTLKHSYRFFQSHFSGSLVANINNMATAIPTMVRIFLYDYVTNFLLILVSLITLWRVSSWCALLVVVWFLLTLFTSMLTTKYALNLANHTAKEEGKLLGYIGDIFSNIIVTRLFSAQPFTLKHLGRLQAAYCQSSQKYGWFTLKFYLFQSIGFQCYQSISILFLIYMHRKNLVTAGDFAMTLSMNLIVTEGLWKLFERMQEFNTLWGKVSQSVHVLLKEPEIQDRSGAIPLIVKSGSISFKEVTFSHSKTTKLFDKETIHIGAKQKVGLAGYSGSGKTTFFKLITRLFDVEQGAILIDGQNISSITQKSLYKAISVVPQECNLFHTTILENIRYGNPHASDSEVTEAAKRACAHEFIEELPYQYKTMVGEGGLNLSGGQRQRIAIARAILKDAPIVLLDEVTANLDVQTENRIYTSLKSLIEDKTALIITHHLDLLKDMDRILVFNKGKIVEDGMHKQLVAKRGLYNALWEMGERKS